MRIFLACIIFSLSATFVPLSQAVFRTHRGGNVFPLSSLHNHACHIFMPDYMGQRENVNFGWLVEGGDSQFLFRDIEEERNRNPAHNKWLIQRIWKTSETAIVVRIISEKSGNCVTSQDGTLKMQPCNSSLLTYSQMYELWQPYNDSNTWRRWYNSSGWWWHHVKSWGTQVTEPTYFNWPYSAHQNGGFGGERTVAFQVKTHIKAYWRTPAVGAWTWDRWERGGNGYNDRLILWHKDYDLWTTRNQGFLFMDCEER